MDILIIPARQDNYIYLLHDQSHHAVAVVDPAEADPVIRTVDERRWPVTVVFNTHHHDDHIAGNGALKDRYHCPVVGSRMDTHRVPDQDVAVGQGDHYPFGGETVTILETPGHTRGHLAFYLPTAGAVFCGDALFSLGCGRLFEGSAADLWQSLCRLRALPGTTRVYCAHEYTLANARFALSIEPNNPALRARVEAAQRQRNAGLPTLPTTIADECATNPFLRADQPTVQAALNMIGATPAEVFGALRLRKDHF